MKRLMIFLIILFCFSPVLQAQELYSLGATFLNRDDANDLDKAYTDMRPLPTTANFESGVSINGSDFKSGGTLASEGNVSVYMFNPSTSESVEILFRIFPDPLHVGQEADIAVTVGYIDINILLMAAFMGTPASNLAEELSIFMLDSDNNILLLPKPFGGQHLVPFRRLTLQSSQDIPLYRGRLSEGFLVIHCYYRLQDGSIVLNKNGISIFILPADLSILSDFLG